MFDLTKKIISKQLDSYSMLIVSKYFQKQCDFIQLLCVCKKFKETTEKLRYNPIPIISLNLFPKIQTQYLYNEYDIKIKGIDNYEIWYTVSYDKYLEHKGENIKFHHIEYTQNNLLQFGDSIPNCVNILSSNIFQDQIKNIIIPSQITSIKNCCLVNQKFSSVQLSTNLTKIDDSCFSDCKNLTSIIFSSSIISIGRNSFYQCKSLERITIPHSVISIGNRCFSDCYKLTSINLSTNLTSLSNFCFSNCISLKTITIPLSIISIGNYCFQYCSKMQSIDIPTSITSIGNYCFFRCNSLITITFSKTLCIPHNCFDDLAKIQMHKK
ncbi:Leucine rich repeat containing protein BspA family protein [Entamoeba marina]